MHPRKVEENIHKSSNEFFKAITISLSLIREMDLNITILKCMTTNVTIQHNDLIYYKEMRIDLKSLL